MCYNFLNHLGCFFFTSSHLSSRTPYATPASIERKIVVIIIVYYNEGHKSTNYIRLFVYASKDSREAMRLLLSQPGSILLPSLGSEP